MEVVEYRPSRLRLDRVDLDYLLNLVRATSGQGADTRVLQALTPTHDPAVYEVTAGPFVGRLGLPTGRWIDFRSRFPLDDVVELIRCSATRPTRMDTLLVDAHAETFLIDAIALAFARELEALVGQGLAKGYSRVRHQRPPYAGRIDTAYHLGRLAARPDKLVTVAHRLTVDTPENQALATALDVLTRVPVAKEATTRLTSLAAAFTRVSRKPMVPSDVGRLKLTRLTNRYRNALGLAEAILRSQSLAPLSSGLAGGSILFFMPKVWESYVAQWLVQQWPGHRIRAPYRFPLTNDGRVGVADATVWAGEDLVALYDAKYKWPNEAPDRADLYQVITYCERLGLDHGTLLYPVETPRRTITVGNKAVHVLGVRPRLTAPTTAGRRPAQL